MNEEMSAFNIMPCFCSGVSNASSHYLYRQTCLFVFNTDTENKPVLSRPIMYILHIWKVLF